MRPAHGGLRRAPAARQRGVVLFISLIVLVAMSFAGLALIRGVDTGNLVVSNLSFKQGAVQAGDEGIEAAVAWLHAHSMELGVDKARSGYYSSFDAEIDPIKAFPKDSEAGWSGKDSGASEPPADLGKNQARYFVHRLCAKTGPAQDAQCVDYSGLAVNRGSRGTQGYQPAAATQRAVFYRITTQVKGPRNTVTVVQAVVH